MAGRTRNVFRRLLPQFEAPDLVLGESASKLANKWTAAWGTSLPGGLWLLAIGTATGIVAGAAIDPKAGLVVRIATAVGIGLLVVLAFLGVVHATFMVRAPAAQRDVAQARLARIKEALESYRIVSMPSGMLPGADTGPDFADPTSDLIRLFIRNEGRAARFAVVIESIQGLPGRVLDHPYALLHWMGRNGAEDEEIPRGEARVIGIGYLITTPGESGKPEAVSFVPQAPSGTRYRRSYQVPPETELIINILVSARGVPQVGFTQPFAMRVKWAGPGHDLLVDRAGSDPPPLLYPQETFGSLFDYQPGADPG